MSSSPAKKHHGVQISSAADIYENLPRQTGQAYGLFESLTSIVCTGPNQESIEFQIKACAYGSASSVLKPEHVYVHKSRLIAPNNKELQSFYFDQDHAILACDSNTFMGSLSNNTAVTGLGIIVDRKEVLEGDSAQPTVAAVMRHSDYDPASKSMVNFTLEYRCPPSRNLLAMQKLFQVGREAQITGFITGWDEANYRWIVTATGIYLTSGSESSIGIGTSSGPATASTTAAGRSRGNFYNRQEGSVNDNAASAAEEELFQEQTPVESEAPSAPHPGPSKGKGKRARPAH